MAIISGVGLIDLGIKKIVGYDECDNYPRVAKLDNITEEPIIEDSWCNNSNKRDLSRNLSLLIVSLPLAILFYKRVKTMLKE
ncbi:hypothetical protein HOI26_01595 [Candidatus Woesearchaeota archaeon]|nr:hypothetical protein [Candidatus Woesearchaeota archaeon]